MQNRRPRGRSHDVLQNLEHFSVSCTCSRDLPFQLPSSLCRVFYTRLSKPRGVKRRTNCYLGTRTAASENKQEIPAREAEAQKRWIMEHRLTRLSAFSRKLYQFEAGCSVSACLRCVATLLCARSVTVHLPRRNQEVERLGRAKSVAFVFGSRIRTQNRSGTRRTLAARRSFATLLSTFGGLSVYRREQLAARHPENCRARTGRPRSGIQIEHPPRKRQLPCGKGCPRWHKASPLILGKASCPHHAGRGENADQARHVAHHVLRPIFSGAFAHHRSLLFARSISWGHRGVLANARCLRVDPRRLVKINPAPFHRVPQSLLLSVEEELRHRKDSKSYVFCVLLTSDASKRVDPAASCT